MSEFDRDLYIEELKKQASEGLITDEEYKESLAFIEADIGQKTETSSITIESYPNPDEEVLRRFHDLFYREIFERPKNKSDEDNECVFQEVDRFVAKIEGKIIGLAEYANEPCEKYEHSTYLDKLIVVKKHRGKNVSRQLLEHVVRDTYQINGINELILHAPEYLMHFYQKLGFFTDYEIFKEGEVPLKRFVLPYDSHARSKIEEIEENEDIRIQEHYERLDKYKTFSKENIDIDENPFLYLLFTKFSSDKQPE